MASLLARVRRWFAAVLATLARLFGRLLGRPFGRPGTGAAPAPPGAAPRFAAVGALAALTAAIAAIARLLWGLLAGIVRAVRVLIARLFGGRAAPLPPPGPPAPPPAPPPPPPPPAPVPPPPVAFPAARVITPRSGKWGSPLPVRYTLTDLQSAPCAVTLTYSIDGGTTFHPATEALGVGSHGTSNLSSSPGGERHLFAWDALGDLRAPTTDVLLRAVATSTTRGPEETAGPFDVVGALVGIKPPPVPPPGPIPVVPGSISFVHVFEPTGVARGTQVRLPFIVSDDEHQRVDLDIDVNAGGTSFQPATLAPTSDRLTGLPAPDVQLHYRAIWDAQRDIGTRAGRAVIRLAPFREGMQTGEAAESGSFDFDTTALPPPPAYVAPDPAGPVTLTVVSGAGQHGLSGQLLPEPLVVRVRDPRGQLVAGARVTFVSGPGSPDVTRERDPRLWTTTNAGGEAAIRVRGGAQATGAGTVEARVVGSPGAVARWSYRLDAPRLVADGAPAGTLVYGQEYRVAVVYDGDHDLTTVDFLPETLQPVRLRVEGTNVLLSHDTARIPDGTSGGARTLITFVPTVLDGLAEVRVTCPARPSLAPLVLQFPVQTPVNASRRRGGGPLAITERVRLSLAPVQPVTATPVGYPGLTLAREVTVHVTDASAAPPDYREEVTANAFGCLPAPVTRALPIRYEASGGTLATTATPGTAARLTVDAGTAVYFTPGGPGPWFVRASAGPNIADAERQPYPWINSSGGQECDQQSVIGGVVTFTLPVQAPSRVAVLDLAAAPPAPLTALQPGARVRLAVDGLSPTAGGAPDDLRLVTRLADGTAAPAYTGPAIALDQRIALTPGAAGQLRSTDTLVVAGQPTVRAPLPVLHSAIPGGWVHWAGDAIDLALELAPRSLDRTRVGPVQSPQESPAGTTPSAGAQQSVLLHNLELRVHRSDLDVISRTATLTFQRTYRSYARMDGPLGPGWAFEHAEALDTSRASGVRRLDSLGLIADFVNGETPHGWFVELRTNLAVDADHSAFELVSPHQSVTHFHADGSLRFHRDRNGNTIRYDYDEDGRLTEIRDELDRPCTLEYWSGAGVPDAVVGRLRRITDASGRTVDFEYYGPGDPDGGAGWLKRVQWPAADTWVRGQLRSAYRRGERYTYAASPADPLAGPLLRIRDSQDDDWLVTRYTPEGHVQEQDFGTTPAGGPKTFRFALDPATFITVGSPGTELEFAL